MWRLGAVAVVGALTGLGCDCGGGPQPGLDAGNLDASSDAPGEGGLDAAADGQPDAGRDLPPCDPELWSWNRNERIHVESRHAPGDNEDQERAWYVMANSATGFEIHSDPGRDWPDEPRVVVRFSPGVQSPLALPPIGDRVLVIGGSCYGGQGYVRVRSVDGELLWEGGDPTCSIIAGYPDGFPWGNIIETRDVSDPSVCVDTLSNEDIDAGDCGLSYRTEHTVVLRLDGDEIPLARNETLELDIAGVRYRAESRGAFYLDADRCTLDLDGPFASAYIAKLPP